MRLDKVLAEEDGVAVAAPVELLHQRSVRHLKVFPKIVSRSERFLTNAALEISRRGFLRSSCTGGVVVVDVTVCYVVNVRRGRGRGRRCWHRHRRRRR